MSVRLTPLLPQRRTGAGTDLRGVRRRVVVLVRGQMRPPVHERALRVVEREPADAPQIQQLRVGDAVERRHRAVQVVRRAPVLAEGLERHRPVGPQLGVVHERERLVEVAGRPLRVPRVEGEHGPVRPRGGARRVRAQRLRVAGEGRFCVTQLRLQRPLCGQESGVRRSERQAVVDVGAGRVEPAARQQQIGAVDQRVDMVRFEIEGPVQVAQRTRVVAQFPQQIGPVEVRLVERRREPDRRRVVRERLPVVPEGAVLRGPLEVVVPVVRVAADHLVVVLQRGRVVAAGPAHLRPVVQQHRAVQELLVRAEVGVGDRHRLVDQREGGVRVAAVQLHEGARVAHERPHQDPLVRIGVHVGDRDRGVHPGQGEILVVVVLRQEARVEHRHQVRRPHVGVRRRRAAPHLLEVREGVRAASQVAQARAGLVGQVPVRTAGLLVGEQGAAAQREVDHGLVEPFGEAGVDGLRDGVDARAPRVGAPLQVVWDRAEPQRRLVPGGEDRGARGVPAGPFGRGQCRVRPAQARIAAGAVGVDEQLREIRVGQQLRVDARDAGRAHGVRGERRAQQVVGGPRAVHDDGQERRVAAAQQHRHQVAVRGVGVVQVPEDDRHPARTRQPGPVHEEFGDAVRDAQRPGRRIEAGALRRHGELGEGLRRCRHDREQFRRDGLHLGGPCGGHQLAIPRDEFGHRPVEQEVRGGERPA
ncbi:hypothetical protein V2W30_04445 [Streptomyces sp. Q6]|uniref:Uncharacterized protein n=1 Tax=Streptomyces citrinus TaxID=3118173 RepID=A0ACD5A660_9ACTN